MLSRDCIAKMYIKCHTGVNQIFEMVKQVRFKCAAGFISENNSNMLSFSFHSLVSHKFYFVLRPDTQFEICQSSLGELAFSPLGELAFSNRLL